MTGFDAVFVAAAVARFLPRPRAWWLSALAPLVQVGVAHLPVGRFEGPVSALLAAALTPSPAPALVLATSSYLDGWDAARAAALWVVVTVLLDGLDGRLEDERLHWRLRGAPIRLVVCAVLYACLLPLAYL